ncbi:MAG: Gx transporter family protein [Desulfobacteraceae bacterium]|nr:Gx transporter family protein [Desulfobacteraceae bacterium]
MTEINKDNKVYKIALLVAFACVLQIAESLIPHPIPGLRLGLSNMLTLTAMVVLGFRYALEVAVLRTVLSAFIMGTFMSPTFILSFTGAVLSTLIMGFFYWLSGVHRQFRLSIIGISIIGAFCHNLVQLYLAYLLLVKHEGIFVFFPWLSIGAVATGWVVGVVAGGVCRRLAEIPQQDQDLLAKTPADGSVSMIRHYVPGTSFLHRLSSQIKISVVFVMALAVLFFSDFWLYLGMFFLLTALAVVSKTPFAFLVSKTRRFLSLLAVAFLLPVFFNSGENIIVTIASFKITYEGLCTGTLFASRILFLLIASCLLMRTTSPEELTRGLAKVLAPLRYLGISQQRVATILSLAWTAVPHVWETTRGAILAANLKKAKNLRNLLPLLSRLIAVLYLNTETENELWETAAATSGNKDSLNPAPTQ